MIMTRDGPEIFLFCFVLSLRGALREIAPVTVSLPASVCVGVTAPNVYLHAGTETPVCKSTWV